VVIQRGFRLLLLLSLVALLGSVFPLEVAAQFPSQGQGGAPAPGGGFPSGGAGRGGFYQGQAYEFTFSWGSNWTLVDEGAQQGLEALTVSNGVSTVTLGGFDMQDTPQNVVTQTANELGGGQWVFNTVTADEPTYAGAYFDTPQGELAYFIYVEQTGPSTGVFVIWEFPVAQYEIEHAAVFDDLLPGFSYFVAA